MPRYSRRARLPSMKETADSAAGTSARPGRNSIWLMGLLGGRRSFHAAPAGACRHLTTGPRDTGRDYSGRLRSTRAGTAAHNLELWHGLLTVPLGPTEGLQILATSWRPSVRASGRVRRPAHNG